MEDGIACPLPSTKKYQFSEIFEFPNEDYLLRFLSKILKFEQKVRDCLEKNLDCQDFPDLELTLESRFRDSEKAITGVQELIDGKTDAIFDDLDISPIEIKVNRDEYKLAFRVYAVPDKNLDKPLERAFKPILFIYQNRFGKDESCKYTPRVVEEF